MAVYNEIGIGRWNRFIQKLTDIKGSPPARQLGSEIVFQHPIFHGAENRYLEGWDRFGVGLTVGPIVGNQSGVRFRNPAGSNVIAVIERIRVEVSAASVLNLEYGTPAVSLSNQALSIQMDTRGRSASTCLVSFNVAALTTLSVVGQTQSTALSIEWIPNDLAEISVPPGGVVQVDGNTVNIGLAATILWRERFLEPAERF